MELPEIPPLWLEQAKRWPDGVIAGGCLRDLILNKPVNDVDIFVPGLTAEESEGVDEYAMGFVVINTLENGIKFQIIKHRFQDIFDVLDHFDTGICKVAYPGYWLLTADFQKDVNNKTITVYRENWRHEPHLEKLKAKFPDFKIENETHLFAEDLF